MHNTTAMRMFVLAMQRGSLAAAGRHLGVSTASVSRQIASLEAELKVRLFNRGARRLTPTEAGEVLLRRAAPVLDELDDMLDSVSLLESRPRGSLRVSVRAVLAARHLVPALPRFLAQNPEVAISLLVSNDEGADLIAENIDVDIRYTRPDSPDLVAKLLAPSRLALVAGAAYAARIGIPDDVKGLDAFETILFEPALGSRQWQFARDGGPVETFEPRGRLSVNDGTALRSALLAGLGIGMMPIGEIDADLAAGRLVALLPHHRIIQPRIGDDGIYAVYQRSAYQPGKLRSFLAFLLSVFGSYDHATLAADAASLR